MMMGNKGSIIVISSLFHSESMEYEMMKLHLDSFVIRVALILCYSQTEGRN